LGKMRPRDTGWRCGHLGNEAGHGGLLWKWRRQDARCGPALVSGRNAR
jgi:hypothetical protein